MNGAESLVQTLLAGGVTHCFANPGTSEMHFVAALDRHPAMRCILCLFEGGATGAADGYYRMTGNVAATLLHLGPGLGNGLANLHNAAKAGSGVVNVVGDHAAWHQAYESPLRSDAPAISRTVSHSTRVCTDAGSVAADGADAIRVARSEGGRIATLILPANTAWDAATGPASVMPPPPRRRPDSAMISAAARALRTRGAALLVGAGGAMPPDIDFAGRIASATGCRLLTPYFLPRIRRGSGSVKVERLEYIVDLNVALLSRVQTLVLCGATRPASFFAYPGKPSLPEAPGCMVIDLCGPEMNCSWALEMLADELGVDAGVAPVRQSLTLPDMPAGPLTVEKIGAALGALMPDEAVVVDEAITSARTLRKMTEGARPHDWLDLCGGAIGNGLPLATGAAVGSPDRKVIALTGDGSAMYTLQSLWTMAREQLDVTVIVIANRGYQVLRVELANVGVESVGQNAQRMLDVVDPLLDWVSLAKGHGVEGVRAVDAESLIAALHTAFNSKGPFLIEAVI